MSYKVLYRKYRPSSFKEVVGQEATVKILKNSIINDKISHAYLFAGPRGTGKTSLARIFAKTINCLNPIEGEACGKCDNCLNFNSSPDIIEIDAASNNGVDEIRELINNVKLMPSASRYKVYIIDEVHMLSQSAFNALLLTLEEPPSHIIFILATTNIENVPITILSRCQKYEFFRISDDLITKHLQEVCDNEKIKYDIEGLKEITELSDGGMRDALSMLDQLSKEKDKITLDLVVKELGSISLVKIKNLIDYIDNNDLENTVSLIAELKKTNLNYKIVVKKIIEILSKKAVDILENGVFNNLDYPKIKRIIWELNDMLNKINLNINPYIIIEMILLDCFSKMPSNKVLMNEKVEDKREEKIENRIKDEPPVKEIIKEEKKEIIAEENETTKQNPIEFDNSELKQIRINNCFAAADKNELNKLKDNWLEFKEKIANQYKGLILDTSPVAASHDYAIITTNVPYLDKEINAELENIEAEYKEVLKTNLKFIALSNEEWQKEKSEYILNIKKGYKYQLQEEKGEETNKANELEELANNLFAKDKLEIK